jgi:hypothetical protein
MERRSVLSLLGTAGLCGCVGTNIMDTRDWEYRFGVVDTPSDNVSDIEIDLNFTDPYSTGDSPATLEISVSNETGSEARIMLGGAGLVHPRKDTGSSLYLYSSSTELEHEGEGVWRPSDPEAIPDFYVASLVPESIPNGEELTRQYRIGTPPNADVSGFPAGRVDFDCEDREFDSLSGTIKMDFELQSSERN